MNILSFSLLVRQLHYGTLDAQIEYCANKRQEDFSTFPPAMRDALVELPYSDVLHPPESFTELRFYTALRNFMETCGYDCFSWRDLYAPVKKRLQNQLSAVINMAKFREGQLQLYQELNEGVSFGVDGCFILCISTISKMFF